MPGLQQTSSLLAGVDFYEQRAKAGSCSSQSVLGRDLSGCYSADRVMSVNSLQKHTANGEPQSVCACVGV